MKGPLGQDVTLVSLKTADRLRTLERLRDRLAEQIDVCEGSRDLALLGARLQSVLAEIDGLVGPREDSAVDEVLRRRQERRGKGLPVSASRTEGRGVGREHG